MAAFDFFSICIIFWYYFVHTDFDLALSYLLASSQLGQHFFKTPVATQTPTVRFLS